MTNATNFRSRVKIERLDHAFFNGHYAGAQEDCFPPPGKQICTRRSGEVDRYVPEHEIAAEEYEITITDHSGYTRSELNELAQLAAAEVAEQRGFELLTNIWQSETSTCGSYYTADTYGTVSAGTYRGSTSVRENTVCANVLSLHVLAYSDQDAIDRGVLYRVGSASAKTAKLAPYRSLYKGTTPFDQRFDQPPTPLGNSRITYLTDAWKHALNAITSASTLRDKYGIKDKVAWAIVDEREKTGREARLESNVEPNWLEKDNVKQALTWMEYRTEAATWGEEVTNHLRWGMGIADTADQLPALEYVGPDYLAEDCQSGFVTSKINGRSVTIEVQFRRGALYRVKIYGRTTDQNSLIAQRSEDFWRQAWRWRKDMVKALREAYGQPESAPDLETRREFCDDLIVDEPCGDPTEMEKALQWKWVRGGTEVVVIGGTVPQITYSNIAIARAVDATKTNR